MNFLEFNQKFPTEEKVIEYFIKIRYEEVVVLIVEVIRFTEEKTNQNCLLASIVIIHSLFLKILFLKIVIPI